MSLWNRLFRREPKREPVTHRIRFDGVTAGRLDDNEDGLKIDVCVFRRHFYPREGDFVIFQSSNGRESRYRIDRCNTPRDPGDQHFLYCSFAPRPPTPNKPL